MHLFSGMLGSLNLGEKLMEYIKDYQVLIGLVLVAVAILIGSYEISDAIRRINYDTGF